jgi:hypothetical protein
MSWKALINQQNLTELLNIVGFVENVPFKAIFVDLLVVFVYKMHFDRNIILFLFSIGLDC